MNEFLKFELRITKINSILILITVVLVLLNLIAIFVEEINQLYKFHYLFYMGYEKNVPTYFSSIILLISGCILYLISTKMQIIHSNYIKHWKFLSIIFLLMSIDEIIGIHELFIIPLRRTFNLSGIFYFSWVILGIAFILIIGIVYLRFLFNLPAKIRNNFILAASLYIGGVIGVELLDGYYAETHGQTNLTYRLMVTLEESLEIFGIIVFIKALLNFMLINKIKIKLIIF